MTGPRTLSGHVIRIGFIALVLIIVVGVLYTVQLLFMPLIAGVLLTFLLQPIVNFFETRGLNRMLVIVGLYVFVSLIIAATLILVAPRLISEAGHFADNLPQYEMMIREMSDGARQALQQRFPRATVPDLYELARTKLLSRTSSMMASIPRYASSLFSIISLVVLIPIITFFFLADGHLIQKALLQVVPNRYFEMFILLFHKMTVAVQLFIRGQLIDALAVGVLTASGLAIIGLPYSIVIGIVAGLGNLIPYLGPVIGFIPAFLVLLVSPEGLTTIWLVKVIAVFATAQFLEGTFIYPIAVGRSVNLHPLVVIIGITVGGTLGGIVGMLIAIPVISVLKVAVEVLYISLKKYQII
jgi:putative permease